MNTTGMSSDMCVLRGGLQFKKSLQRTLLCYLSVIYYLFDHFISVNQDITWNKAQHGTGAGEMHASILTLF